MTREEALGLCQRWVDAMDRRDAGALAALYTEDAVLESPMAGQASGRDDIIKTADTLFKVLAGGVTAEAPIIDGDRVAIVTVATGTHRGPIMGLPPTGRPFRMPIVFLLELRDGKIARERRIYDFTGLLVQVGVLKAKPG